MLVLTRTEGEYIQLKMPGGLVVEVYVSRIKAKQARIGIQAPPEVKVLRGECVFHGEVATESDSDFYESRGNQ